jgi:26S proteasome regulatory subunit N2
MKLSSVAGIISLLDDEETDVKAFALKRLDDLTTSFWVEIADSIEKIEKIYDDEKFPDRPLAALVASKVFYNIEAYEEAVSYALSAGKLFDVEASSLYVETIISKCIDEYVSLQTQNFVAKDSSEMKPVDPRLEEIVQRMFEKCLINEQYKQLIGIALESRRLDVFRQAVTTCKRRESEGDKPVGTTSLDLLSYAMSVCLKFIDNREWRDGVMRAIVDLYREEHNPHFIQMAQCMIFLNDHSAVAKMLETLLDSNEELAYQIAFDLYENATQQFVMNVGKTLQGEEVTSGQLGGVGTPYSEVTLETTNSSVMDGTETPMDTTTSGASSTVPPPVAETTSPTADATPVSNPSSETPAIPTNGRERLVYILSGESTIEQHLQFLIRNNKTDLLLLKQVKDGVRNSIQHNATVICNGLMHCGTTTDAFLRDNLDWLARATNWAKFTATSTLGVIHRGHEKDALDLLSAYLPKSTASSTSGFMEGGGLYALGLIHAGHGTHIIDYLMGQLKDAGNEPVRHGACLGLGLAALGTGRQDVYDMLKQNLYLDDANVGEAAGIAMGLVMLGSLDQSVFSDMLGYAHDTQHEKIVRGLCVGIALVFYRALEAADAVIDELRSDKDALLRRSASYVTAMAYCGTEHNDSLRKLLRVAVTDVNDDVRRASVEAIGFLLFRSPEQCPNVVKLLAESYNMHVRYGAAMALGIACAGTGNRDALNILQPLMKDSQSLVRQGAMIASAMVLIQQTQVKNAKAKEFKDVYSATISDKHEDTMTKFGAILAIGIVNGGGRNCTINLQSRSGHINLQSVVGMLVFLQVWYWFPCANFLSLCFTPTCVIALNKELKMPKLQLRSAAPPSHFAYPAAVEENKKKETEKVETAVLSITAKAKAREKQKAAKSSDKMDVDVPAETQTPTQTPQPMDTETAVDAEPAAEKKEEKKKEAEPAFEILENPARVMPAQRKVISIVEGSAYSSIKSVSLGGIVIVSRSKTDTELPPEEFVARVPLGGSNKPEDDEDEPEAPEEFEWAEE